MGQLPSLSPKIIGTGFQKTGTSSLRDALRILGYRVGDNNFQQLWPIVRGDWNRVLRKLDKYDAVEDNPWPLIYREIDKRVPGCKFIHTIREEESWFQSVSRHIGDLRDPMHEWIYGRGKGLPKEDKANTIAVYRAHNESVQAYFADRPHDLLVLDIRAGQGWNELCAFLGKSIPDTPFPHANNASKNRSRSSLYRAYKHNKKQLKYALQIAYGDMRGYW